MLDVQSEYEEYIFSTQSMLHTTGFKNESFFLYIFKRGYVSHDDVQCYDQTYRSNPPKNMNLKA